MILKIYNDIEILIDDEDVERILRVLKTNCQWHYSSQNKQVTGWCKTIKGTYSKFRLSRVIMNCYDNSLDVDHKNHNSFDYRKSELRVCSHQENCFNTKRTGSTGVSFKKDKNKWTSRIRTKTKGRVFLGYFDTKEEAERAYAQAVIKYHGEFAHKDKVT